MQVKGLDGTISLDHEGVTLTFGRLADAAKKRHNPRRIPYTAINVVETTQPRGLRRGFLRLRLAGEPADYQPPKVSQDVNAVECSNDRHAEQLPDLALAIRQRIAGQVPQPHPELLESTVQQDATPTAQRPDVADALTRAGMTWGHRLEVKRLGSILWDDETVLEMAGGALGDHLGVVVLTDQRLVFFDQRLLSQKVEDFPVKLITAVQATKKLTGAGLTVFISGSKASIGKMSIDRAETIARRIRELQQPAASAASAPGAAVVPAAAAPNVMEQLRQLGELHQAGVLTDAEFQTKKQELLGRL